MIATILIGLAAGCASASMFTSILSGALISLVLFHLTPLPLMVVGLGWGPLSAAIGGVASAMVLFWIGGLPTCMAFVLAAALPAWWLAHLAMLGRPIAAGTAAGGEDKALEWYPVGRILLWAVALATMATTAKLLAMGSDGPSIQQAMRAAGANLLRSAGIDLTDRSLDALAMIAPAGATIAAVANLTFNLWLAAKIAAASGRLHRPWPDLKATALPPTALAVFCAALAFCFTGGLIAIVAQIVAAALTIAYALVGFAVLHTLTLARKNRSLWLGCAYAIVAISAWTVLVAALLGITDTLFGLRQRYLRARPPPLASS
jgi:Predicted membrane protein (DUF2232)